MKAGIPHRKIVMLLALTAVSGCALLSEDADDPAQYDARWDTSTADPVIKPAAASGLGYRPDSRDLQNPPAQPAIYQYQDPLRTGFYADQTHKSLHEYADQLAMGLMDKAAQVSTARIGVASFVRLNASLQETTVLGNQLAEYLMAELQEYGLSVVDFKVNSQVQVTARGDLAFSRSSKDATMTMDHVVTGTMVETPRGVRVNARIIALDTGQLIAASTIQLPAFMVTSLNQTASAD
ncbi:FlgO family outer membrane protein [Salinimonas sediminis]|nr:FlgO family outer membrane protein [Salinimonas sediminis]